MTEFETKMVNHLVQLLMAERTATIIGDGDTLMLKRAEYAGFTDALKMSLSERFTECLIRVAIKEVETT